MADSLHRPPSVTARAGTNIALVKYWGKRDSVLNLPATGSLSLTLAELGTETRVRFASDAAAPDGRDRIIFDNRPADEQFTERVRRFLDLVRQRASSSLPAEVVTRNSIPTAAGLASSASGFAALALAATRAAGLRLSNDELSALARRGSGSAARSIHGGFVGMAKGERPDGKDAVARTILAHGVWDLRLVVALTSAGAKAISSTEAMERTARTSPYHSSWLAATERDLEEAPLAIAGRDLAWLGQIAERSALRMHASAMAADPPILYWNGATVGAMEAVTALRTGGIPAYFTIDAGPHVKVICNAENASMIEAALRAVPGVIRTLIASTGPGAEVVEEQAAP